MADRLVVDLDTIPLTWPLDGGALEDLRWYLENYLTAPFGVYEDRGARIETRLADWGQAVFRAVFGFTLVGSDVELVLRSAAPSLLALPWELMAAPDRELPLVLDVAGVSRSLTVADGAETVPVPGGQLRVLMVISRPAGTSDVGYRMVARPLLDRLEAVRGAVDLVVLRPPTLDALRAELESAAAAGQPYQVVHFDGHGALRGGEGMLVFERPSGGEHYVPAAAIAKVLGDTRVPVVVLNACQSGAVGKELEAAVATALLRMGVASVVAMAYTVYAVAAAEFMTAFYDRLFSGGTVSSAVTAGRHRMFSKPGRPSPKGELPLADWLVPVHYSRREVSFPQAAATRAAGLPSLAEALEAVPVAGASVAEAGIQSPDDLDAVDGVFVGRDALFYELEVAARLQKAVVLVGPGGTGKTELAKAFARWWRDTGGVERPDFVFWHSFEPGVATFGLDGVIIEIGLQLHGAEFALLERSQRRAVVLDALAEHRALLIWDNFESVHSMPDPGCSTPPLDEAGRDELREFLSDLAAHGKSPVLITSRTAEDWLGDVGRIWVGGLSSQEAVEYADILLAPYWLGRKRREGRAFADLMEWLDGHPLSMRLILPLLDNASPPALLAALQGTAPPTGEAGAETIRARSLAASITYSYAHLPESTRRLLPAVSLFQAVADANVLGLFSQVPDVPERFADVTAQDWVAALDDAARVGLLTSIGYPLYRIHPALPSYLATAWRAEEPEDHDLIRGAAIRALLAAHADMASWLYQQITSADAGLALTVVELERRTQGSLLGYALDHALWDAAQAIAAPLNRYWESRGLDAEADAWADRARIATEAPDGTPPMLETPQGDLWLFVASSQADREQRRHHFDAAEATYLQIMTAIEARARTPGLQRLLANYYHWLGNLTHRQGRLGEAEEWYCKSLAIKEELGNRPGMATTYHQLGMVAADQGRLHEAEEWYRKSLAIDLELGNRPSMAITYHELGIVAEVQGRLEVAEEWHRKSLVIDEELGDLPGMAVTYHELGVVAQESGRLAEAEEWYRKSLDIKEERDDRPGMAVTYVEFGRLAEHRGQLAEALAWAVKCVALFSEFPHPATEPGPHNLIVYTVHLGIDALEECWRQVTGQALPDEVRDHVEARIQEWRAQLPWRAHTRVGRP